MANRVPGLAHWKKMSISETPGIIAAGRWPLAAGRWPLAAGRWPLAAGRWPLYLAFSHPSISPSRFVR
ncbi:hypothetical protein CCR95_10285 [Thiocystis minor]|nr:hypothetical protein [Thiocystis minor]